MVIDYGYIYVMDVCMNTFLLADYVNTSTRAAIGARCPWCIVLSAEPFFCMFSTVDWNFYMLM